MMKTLGERASPTNSGILRETFVSYDENLRHLPMPSQTLSASQPSTNRNAVWNLTVLQAPDNRPCEGFPAKRITVQEMTHYIPRKLPDEGLKERPTVNENCQVNDTKRKLLLLDETHLDR